MIQIPAAFRKNTENTFGDLGRKWLEQLPSLVQSCYDKWALTQDGEFQDLSFNFALPVRRLGERAVLKLGPHPKGLAREARALLAYDGCGAVRLLEQDESAGALLMERALPGNSLRESTEQEALASVSVVAERLLSVKTEKLSKAFTPVGTWGLGFEKFLRESQGTHSIPTEMIFEADGIFKQLQRTAERETLLHADLHQSNILKAEREEWLAIDPKGIWGDPAYELGAFVRNPMPTLAERKNLETVLANRLDYFAKNFGFGRERIWGWSYSQCVLAAIWSIGDRGEEWRDWIRVATVLRSLR